jgi:hypothetical protein
MSQEDTPRFDRINLDPKLPTEINNPVATQTHMHKTLVILISG